ncbi:MAG: Flp family type IVb pilin [Actinobacteria bacterium]|nr:MAG: Flp family type IVb pilin [Actinomycetota bacterium]
MRLRQRSLTAARNRSVQEQGQALVEYALILALIALVTIGVLQVLGVTLSGVLNKVSTNMSAVSNP